MPTVFVVGPCQSNVSALSLMSPGRWRVATPRNIPSAIANAWSGRLGPGLGKLAVVALVKRDPVLRDIDRSLHFGRPPTKTPPRERAASAFQSSTFWIFRTRNLSVAALRDGQRRLGLAPAESPSVPDVCYEQAFLFRAVQHLAKRAYDGDLIRLDDQRRRKCNDVAGHAYQQAPLEARVKTSYPRAPGAPGAAPVLFHQSARLCECRRHGVKRAARTSRRPIPLPAPPRAPSNPSRV